MTSLIFGSASLDRMLAAGADPHADPKLERRARKLTSRRFRAGLAAGIRNVVDAAEEPPRWSSQVPLARGEITRERHLLLELASDLRGGDDLSPRGIALVEQLLTDGASPIYRGNALEGTLRGAIVHARAALYMS
jgi:hypothetical protein